MESSSVYHGLVYAAIASSVATTCTHPIDTIKVKVQIEGRNNISARSLFYVSIKSYHGIQSLFNGLSSALLRSVTYGAIRYAIYSPIKKIIESEFNPSLGTKLLSGSLAGCLASALCNPTDLIKVRMQQSSIYHYTGVFDAIGKIIKTNGILGLWTGVGPTCMRATILAAAELASYDEAKYYLQNSCGLSDGLALYFSSSLLSGFLSAAVTSPFDFAKSRIMSQGPIPEYKGMVDCMFKSVKRDGILVLWSGFTAAFTRLGPNIIITFLIMENLRTIVEKR